MQIEAAGTPLLYTLKPNPNTIFHMHNIIFSFTDNIASTITDGTAHGLSHDQILGLSALANGMTLRLTKDFEVKFSIQLRKLSDFLETGSIVNMISDGTDTQITIVGLFFRPLVLDSRLNDRITITINDDLSALLGATVFANGALEE